jgi:hypothetical protein
MSWMRYACLGLLVLFVSCGGPPKSTVPPLNPQEAGTLLHYNNKAQNWLKYVRRQNAACDYRLDLPDQSSHPTTIDLNHIIMCGTSPSPKEFDASVSFDYDQDQKRWVISKFSS